MRHPIHSGVVLMLALAALLLQGCAALGHVTPETFDERLAYGYGMHDAMLRATTRALDDGLISSGDASSMLEQADNAYELLLQAEDYSMIGDVRTADGRLRMATAVLQSLDDYLTQRATQRTTR